MKTLIKQLAVKAGFDYDPRDCNFYGNEGWINIELYDFAQRIINECVCMADAHTGNHKLGTIIREKFE